MRGLVHCVCLGNLIFAPCRQLFNRNIAGNWKRMLNGAASCIFRAAETGRRSRPINIVQLSEHDHETMYQLVTEINQCTRISNICQHIYFTANWIYRQKGLCICVCVCVLWVLLFQCSMNVRCKTILSQWSTHTYTHTGTHSYTHTLAAQQSH